MSKTQFYRLLMGLVGLTGVSLQLYESGPGMLLYYTVLSNILVFMSFFYFVYYESRRESINHHPLLLRYKAGITLAIALTFLVYHFLLAPLVSHHDYWNLKNFLVHYISPLAMILDTLVLDTRNSYRLTDPFKWAILPILYASFSIINGLIFKLPVPGADSSPFPYFFLDVQHKGWAYVLIFALILAIYYILAGYLLMLIKTVIGAKSLQTTSN